MVSGKHLDIQMKCLVDEDFYRMVINFSFDNKVRRLYRPTLRNKKVLAWGYLKDSEGGGFNILLVENEGELYGEWYTLWNTNSGIFAHRQRQPEPFYFDFNEIEKELPLITATDIYNTEVKPMDMAMFLGYFVTNI